MGCSITDSRESIEIVVIDGAALATAGGFRLSYARTRQSPENRRRRRYREWRRRPGGRNPHAASARLAVNLRTGARCDVAQLEQ